MAEVTVELTKHEDHPVYIVKVGAQSSEPHRYRHWEAFRDQLRTELGMKKIIVSEFPGKLGKQAYGFPLNDAECEGRRQVRIVKLISTRTHSTPSLILEIHLDA